MTKFSLTVISFICCAACAPISGVRRPQIRPIISYDSWDLVAPQGVISVLFHITSRFDVGVMMMLQ